MNQKGRGGIARSLLFRGCDINSGLRHQVAAALARARRFAVEELLDDIYFAPTYGNTLMGLAVHMPRLPEDNWAIIYYPPSPRAMIEVVDFDDWTKLVDYGETGRVRLTTLTKEFFMPRFLERDECERERPYGNYVWDGVRNVRPFSRFSKSVVEGVY